MLRHPQTKPVCSQALTYRQMLIWFFREQGQLLCCAVVMGTMRGFHETKLNDHFAKDWSRGIKTQIHWQDSGPSQASS